MIPKIIHQIWFDKKQEDMRVPRKYLSYIKSWIDNNPEAIYYLWTNKAIHYIFSLPEARKYRDFFYFTLKRHIERCDFIRYLIMYFFGGIYIDMDVMCYKPLDIIFNSPSKKFMFLVEPIEFTRRGSPYKQVFNGIIGSEARNPFWLEFCDYIVENYNPTKQVYINTGPWILGAYISETIPFYEDSDYFEDTCLFAQTDFKDNMFAQCKRMNMKNRLAKINLFDGTDWTTTVSISDAVKYSENYLEKYVNIVDDDDDYILLPFSILRGRRPNKFGYEYFKKRGFKYGEGGDRFMFGTSEYYRDLLTEEAEGFSGTLSLSNEGSWVMIGLITVLGAGAIYSVMRKKKTLRK